MDVVLVATGIGLLAIAVVLLLAYLLLERGSLLDPISISWAGFAMFVALAAIGTGIVFPVRDSSNYRTPACLLLIAGTIAYCIGLYSGKAIRFVRRLPYPRGVITKSQLWVACIVSGMLFVVCLVLSPLMPSGSSAIGGGFSIGTLLYQTMASVTLITVIGLTMFKGSPLTRILMGLACVAACLVMLNLVWSRRPLAGVLIAAAGLFYHFRIANRSTIVKLGFLGGMGAAVLVLVSFMEATRGARFYSRALQPLKVFSAENAQLLFAGVEIHYRTYEFALQQFPEQYNYLYGKGYVPLLMFYVPRVIWPEKPFSTGYVISQLWFQEEQITNNLGIPPFGELYVNFGPIGMLIGMFVLGRLVRATNTYLRLHTANVVVWAAWLMIVPDFATEWRGDFTSMTLQSILRLAGFLAIIWASGLVSSRRGSTAHGTRPPMPQPGHGVPAMRYF